MTEMQAAIGRVQLSKLEEWNARRTANAEKIIEILNKYACVRVPCPADDIRHAYYRLYAFVVPDHLADGWSRDRVMQEINNGGVPCFSGSCPEIYNEKAFECEGMRPSQPLPNAKSLGPVSLAFLVHPTLSSEDMDLVCSTIDSVLSVASI
jgi:dTDP-4-amino-4,6-dideoxygalactose transaminase